MDLEPAEAAENFNSRTHVECDGDGLTVTVGTGNFTRGVRPSS